MPMFNRVLSSLLFLTVLAVLVLCVYIYKNKHGIQNAGGTGATGAVGEAGEAGETGVTGATGPAGTVLGSNLIIVDDDVTLTLADAGSTVHLEPPQNMNITVTLPEFPTVGTYFNFVSYLPTDAGASIDAQSKAVRGILANPEASPMVQAFPSGAAVQYLTFVANTATVGDNATYIWNGSIWQVTAYARFDGGIVLS